MPDPGAWGANRIRVDGKFFARGRERFHVRGVTYGTFRPRGDDARFPSTSQVVEDTTAMADAGFTVMRTYTTPPDDVLERADAAGLLVMPDVFFPDWRYLVGASARQVRAVNAEARKAVRSAARRFAGDERVFALSIGNEIPADVLRWLGADRVAKVVSELADTVRAIDSERLVTFANYPTAEYLNLDGLDFLTFNIFLEDPAALRRYLTRLHHLAGERPLVIGELGRDTGATPAGEAEQAQLFDAQLEVALERGVAGVCAFSWTDEWWVGDAAVEGWHFGLTRADRSPRPALDVVRGWNQRTVADLSDDWPSISVVVCAFNGEATIDECLRHTCALRYPNLEIIVVDDGSTDATAVLAGVHERVRLLSIPHGGLSVARNVGFQAATGELIAYLDSDAYPSPEWLYFLALGFDDGRVGGVGGPNVGPPGDAAAASQVDRAPGGPVQVLVSDDRAEHVPGCNMAFWREVLEEVGGFDPVYTAAGDDVDLCWKVLNRGWEIGFHPAALVWHHRRGGLRAYLRQQRGYGRAEALVRVRHPDRFTVAGSARWRGRIYGAQLPVWGRQRVYRGPYGSAAFQSVYASGGYAGDLVHQLGVPAAVGAVFLAPFAFIAPRVLALSVLALVALAVLGVVDAVGVRLPRRTQGPAIAFRSRVAAMHLLQPIARSWGRVRSRRSARRALPTCRTVPGPIERAPGGVLVLPASRPRTDVAIAATELMRQAGVRTQPSAGWDDFDARLIGSFLVRGDLRTSSHVAAAVQLRIVRRLAPRQALSALALEVVLLRLGWNVGAAALPVAAAFDLAGGWWRTGPLVRRTLGAAAVEAAADVIDLRDPTPARRGVLELDDDDAPPDRRGPWVSERSRTSAALVGDPG